MEINQLKVHERVINFFIEILNKGCSELMKKGTNMWIKKYINLYDSLVSKILATESLIWI